MSTYIASIFLVMVPPDKHAVEVGVILHGTGYGTQTWCFDVVTRDH